MLEPEIAAFVAAVGAWYPANALARSPAEQRRVYERFAAAWTPASLPEGLVQEDAACHAPDGRAILLRCHRP
ncbi:alpha/beta hydrolase, partial [Verminephrobacter sp. Larva24]